MPTKLVSDERVKEIIKMCDQPITPSMFLSDISVICRELLELLAASSRKSQRTIVQGACEIIERPDPERNPMSSEPQHDTTEALECLRAYRGHIERGLKAMGHEKEAVLKVEQALEWLLREPAQTNDEIIDSELREAGIDMEAANRRMNEMVNQAYRTRVRQLEIALAESLALQAHYARLLNQYDGGERRIFGLVDEWIKRLKETGKIA